MKKLYMAFFYGVFLIGLVAVLPVFGADKVFQDNRFGYTISYPQDWDHGQHSRHIIVFTKKDGADANLPVVGIQNLLSMRAKDGKYKDLDAVLADFENQLRVTKRAEVYPAETFTYSKQGVTLTGKQFMAAYTFKDKNYKQWVIVIPRKGGEIFHAWIYSAPEEQYDKYLATAQAMLDSWVITEH